MLEVSQLDVSNKKLPCKMTDINHIFNQEMDRLKRTAKSNIHYHLETPRGDFIDIYQILALAIENLLDNAN